MTLGGYRLIVGAPSRALLAYLIPQDLVAVKGRCASGGVSPDCEERAKGCQGLPPSADRRISAHFRRPGAGQPSYRRYHSPMPAPKNDRAALERERDELPALITTCERELLATAVEEQEKRETAAMAAETS